MIRFLSTFRSVVIGISIALASICAWAVDSALLSEAQKLLESGQAQQAYVLLKKEEDRYLGDPAFDSALAQAAVGIGARNEATLILERLLNVDGQAIAARMELARLYQSMSNYEQAKYQFGKVLASTSHAGFIQEAQDNIKIVEDRLSKRRKRPVFELQMAVRAESANETNKQSPSVKSAEPTRDLKAVMSEARQILRNGQPIAAYDMLMEREFEGSGDVDFDYLLGIAAIDAGKPDKATLALERVLAVKPDFAGARIDMGRAYMLLGNMLQAKDEFDAILKLNPPQTVRRQIEGFVAEIDNGKQVSKTTWGGFFGISLGRDSNVNGAPRDAEQFIPIVGSVLLDPDSVETPSAYAGLSGRIQVNHRMNENVAWYAGMDMDLQRNFQAAQFDRSAADLRAGSIFTLNNHELELSVVVGKTYLEQRNFRNLVGGAVQWRFNVNEDNQIQGVAQFNHLSYPQRAASVFDTDQTIVGFSWLRLFGENKQALGFVGAYKGTETDSNGNPSGVKDFYGVRAGGQWGFGARWALYSTLAFAQADYDGFDISHQKTRDDKHFDWSLGVNYLLWENWSLRPQINLTRHDSNIGLYDFNRREISVTLRRDWR